MDTKFRYSNGLITLFKNIIPIFELKDNYQIVRFESIIGIPQLILENSNFGYQKLMNEFSNLIDFRGTISNNDTCCFLKKIFDLKNYLKISRDYVEERTIHSISSLIMELFLTMIGAATKNQELLKYIALMPSQEPCHEE